MTFFDGDIREFSYPEFGFSDSATELWQEFYAFFFAYTTTRYQCYNTFFTLPLASRLNKLEGLSLENLSSPVLEFEGKGRANPIGAPFRCFLLG